MRRHQLHVPSPVQDVIDVLRAVGQVMVELTDTHRGMLHFEGGAGFLHHDDGTTVLDLLEYDDGRHVTRIIDGLRVAGLAVDHREM